MPYRVETQFNIGHIFYMPRCYNRPQVKTILIDGFEYTRFEDNFEPEVKKKTVIAIKITSDRQGTKVRYQCKEDDDDFLLGSWYDESELRHYSQSYNDAWATAQLHALAKREYFGPGK